MDSNIALDKLVEQAVAAPGRQRKRLIGKATSQVLPGKQKKKTGRPTLFNQKIADDIVSRIAGGQVLPTITKELKISLQNVYDWLDKHPKFLEQYNRAREQQAKTLVDSLLSESEDLQNDRALAVRVRSEIVKWVAARFAPSTFGDVRRVELKGEIKHTHVHDLAPEQRRRIAESWIMSQQDENDGLLIEGQVVQDKPETGVQVVADEQNRVIPTRRKLAVQESGRRRKEESADQW